MHIWPQWLKTLRPRQNGCHFPDNIFKWIFLNENAWISIKISSKFVPKGLINNIPALVQIMAWRRPGDKPLSEPMISLPMDICVTRPQWVQSPIDFQWGSWKYLRYLWQVCNFVFIKMTTRNLLFGNDLCVGEKKQKTKIATTKDRYFHLLKSLSFYRICSNFLRKKWTNQIRKFKVNQANKLSKRMTVFGLWNNKVCMQFIFLQPFYFKWT